MQALTYPATLGFIAILVFLSLAPARSALLRHIPKTLQKTMHVVLYGVLTVLLVWSFRGARLPGNIEYLVAWLIAVALGALMELLQLGRPDRFGEWRDVGRNALGATLGALTALMIHQI